MVLDQVHTKKGQNSSSFFFFYQLFRKNNAGTLPSLCSTGNNTGVWGGRRGWGGGVGGGVVCMQPCTRVYKSQ